MITAADSHTYTLKFSGAPDGDFLAAYCPAETMLTIGADTFTLSNLRTDQAGVLGIIRSLHNLGYTLLSLSTGQGDDR